MSETDFSMNDQIHIFQELQPKFEDALLNTQETCDEIPTVWVARHQAHSVLHHLKTEVEKPFRMLYDLTAIDEVQAVEEAAQTWFAKMPYWRSSEPLIPHRLSIFLIVSPCTTIENTTTI